MKTKICILIAVFLICQAGAVDKVEASQYADEILERSAALERLHGK